MFAIIELKGHQFKVEKGQTLSSLKMDAEEGDKVVISEVLLVNKDGDNVIVGAPYVDGASVELKVVKQFRDEKVRVFKMKSKKRSRKTHGHRSYKTEYVVENIKA